MPEGFSSQEEKFIIAVPPAHGTHRKFPQLNAQGERSTKTSSDGSVLQQIKNALESGKRMLLVFD